MMIDLVSIYDEVRHKLDGEKRPLIRRTLERIQEADRPFIFIVRAPTGYGKTAISISCAIYSVFDSSLFTKVVHILPMRSIVEDIHHRASKIMGEYAVKEKMMDVDEEKLEVFHLFPLNVTTVDTFTWDVMKLNTKKIGLIRSEKAFGYDYLTQASLLDSLLFFDEAHYILEDENMRAVFAVVLDLLLRYKTSMIISTATLSSGYEEYFSHLAEVNGYEFEVFSPDENDPFILRESKKDFNIHLVEECTDITESITHLIDSNKVNLIVVNSPHVAVKTYNKIASSNEINVFLLHGNMKRSHRDKVLERIREVTRKKSSSVIVTTQVIEAGVDISSDVLITEISVAQSLLQRMGRVARYDEKYAEIYILKSSGEPYPTEKVVKTWKVLQEKSEKIHPRIPATYHELLNAVHGRFRQEVDLKLSPRYTTPLKTLSAKLLDLRIRAPAILSQIEKILRQSSFLREIAIPVKVEDEYILFSPNEVEKMFQGGLVKIEIEGKIEHNIIRNFYELGRDFALGKKHIVVEYVGEYDSVRGIIP